MRYPRKKLTYKIKMRAGDRLTVRPIRLRLAWARQQVTLVFLRIVLSYSLFVRLGHLCRPCVPRPPSSTYVHHRICFQNCTDSRQVIYGLFRFARGHAPHPSASHNARTTRWITDSRCVRTAFCLILINHGLDVSASQVLQTFFHY